MAILWLFLGHRDYLMAPRLLQHEYLLAPMIWSDFEHFRMSGSIICRQLLLSLTRCVRSASSFICWLIHYFSANFFEQKMSLQLCRDCELGDASFARKCCFIFYSLGRFLLLYHGRVLHRTFKIA